MEDNGFDLRLEPYCAFCPLFEPDVEKIDVTVASDERTRVLTTIRCSRRKMCEELKKRIAEARKCMNNGGTK